MSFGGIWLVPAESWLGPCWQPALFGDSPSARECWGIGLGGLALTFTGVHLAGLVLDSYFEFGPVELLIPFTSSYRPAAVAIGVVSLYLLAAVQLTSLLRRRLSKKVWRSTHYVSFPLFVAATLHGLTAGTDVTGGVLTYVMVAVSGLVVALTVMRFRMPRSTERRSSAGVVNRGRVSA